jgi:hypothetical protein
MCSTIRLGAKYRLLRCRPSRILRARPADPQQYGPNLLQQRRDPKRDPNKRNKRTAQKLSIALKCTEPNALKARG